MTGRFWVYWLSGRQGASPFRAVVTVKQANHALKSDRLLPERVNDQ